MIDAKELRIGNYIYYSEFIRQVTAFVPPKVGVDNSITLLENVKPIPLTPEVLFKYGTMHQVLEGGIDCFFIGSDYAVCLDGEDWSFHKVIGEDEITLLYDEPHFKYLHHLQNIIFALTGQELPLTPSS